MKIFIIYLFCKFFFYINYIVSQDKSIIVYIDIPPIKSIDNLQIQPNDSNLIDFIPSKYDISYKNDLILKYLTFLIRII